MASPIARPWEVVLERSRHPIVERVALGLALSALFGAACAARHGLVAMLVHAVGVPLGFAAAAGLATPALCIGVAHFDLPLDAGGVGLTVSRAIAVAGRVMAGTAPAVLLLTVSVESHESASAVAAAGLALGGALGLREVVRGFGAGQRLLLFAFVPFVVAITARVWWMTLPILGRGAP